MESAANDMSLTFTFDHLMKIKNFGSTFFQGLSITKKQQRPNQFLQQKRSKSVRTKKYLKNGRH
jgi:hypothetical protein